MQIKESLNACESSALSEIENVVRNRLHKYQSGAYFFLASGVPDLHFHFAFMQFELKR